jgi:hypothetical protein
MSEHACVQLNGSIPDGESWLCLDGILYGPCGAEECSGSCEDNGDCTCRCHDEETLPNALETEITDD